MRPIEPPYPRGYDPSAKCDYHAGAVGHSTENCRALKLKVQDLINAKWLNFKEDSPNVGNNPLPGHGGSSMNAVEGGSDQLLIREVGRIKTPMKFIFEKLCQLGMVKGDACEKEKCGSTQALNILLKSAMSLKKSFKG